MHLPKPSPSGLHPDSRRALEVSNVALFPPHGKPLSECISDHQQAAAAHRVAAQSSELLRSMHETHAKIHDEAVVTLQTLQRSRDRTANEESD